MNDTASNRQISFSYNRFADLFYYLLAHMPINCAADVSDQAYTAEMAGELGIFPGIPPKLIDYYGEHFDRLMIADFIPLTVKNTQQFREALVSSGMLTEEDMALFADPVIGICERVSERFYGWWTQHHEAVAPWAEKVYARFQALADRFRCFFAALQTKTEVLFSYSLRKNGRAFTSPDGLTVYLTFPEKDGDLMDCFLQYLHECTHSVTDPMLNREIRMADGSHEISEYQVLCFDEYLVETACPELTGAYRGWIGQEYLSRAHEKLGEAGEARLRERLAQMLPEAAGTDDKTREESAEAD